MIGQESDLLYLRRTGFANPSATFLDKVSQVLQKSRGFIALGKLESASVEIRFIFLTSANYITRILSIDGLYSLFIHCLAEPVMSVSALHIYEQLTDAPDDKTRARIIAEAIGQLEDRYPQLREVATQPQLRETELRLQKEIKEVEAKLQKEIQQTRLEIKEVEARLSKEIH